MTVVFGRELNYQQVRSGRELVMEPVDVRKPTLEL